MTYLTKSIYVELVEEFKFLLKTLGLDQKHDHGRHKITFKIFRDFVKTQISEEGHSDFT